jgi:hypothetical protein
LTYSCMEPIEDSVGFLQSAAGGPLEAALSIVPCSTIHVRCFVSRTT